MFWRVKWKSFVCLCRKYRIAFVDCFALSADGVKPGRERDRETDRSQLPDCLWEAQYQALEARCGSFDAFWGFVGASGKVAQRMSKSDGWSKGDGWAGESWGLSNATVKSKCTAARSRSGNNNNKLLEQLIMAKNGKSRSGRLR